MDDWCIAPPSLNNEGEHRDQDDRDHRLEAELGTQDDGTNDQQRDIHADASQGDLPSPHGVEHVGQTIHTARSHVIGIHEHHVAHGEKG